MTAHAIAARANPKMRNPRRPGESGTTGAGGCDRGAAAEGAVVVTVTVIVDAVLLVVSGFGETVHVDSAGAPVQVKSTVPANPPSPLEESAKIAGCPGETVTVVADPGGGMMVKSSPVPLREALCEPLPALSEMLRLPVREPPAVGLKVTAMVQVAPALMVPPHVFVWEKSPLVEMLEIVSGALPTFISVTVCAALVVSANCDVKESDWGDKLTAAPMTVTET